jgi:hypothetical protein
VSQSASVWLVLVVALVAANLPFANERLFGLIALRSGRKGLGLRFAELLVFYFLTGGLGLLFERRVGQIAAQGWEFYAVSGALFLVLAFPGFTWRYLIKHHRS